MEREGLQRSMVRLADGDRSAFAPVFEALWPVLRAFAGRAVGPADGEDAAQAALLRVFSRASEFDPSRDALAWALGIAAFECRTLRKRRARRAARELPVAAAADWLAPADVAPSPEAALIERDLRAAVATVIGGLRPIDAETILALESGDRDVPGATFRKRLERAVSRFRSAWRDRHGAG